MNVPNQKPEPLPDHVLLYDEVCPLCRAYSCAFIHAGWLEQDGRAPYQDTRPELSSAIDPARAVDEIALVNRRTGEVTYGARSLMVILQHRFPLFAPLFRQSWFNWLAQKAYRFVSFNRRAMVPARDYCTYKPSFNLAYRLSYLAVTWLVTAVFLHHYSKLLVPLIPSSSFTREFLICGGQIFWQSIFMAMLDKQKTWDYLGNLMTISLAGGFALALIQAVLGWYHGPCLFGVLFTGVAGLMFLEHIRRTRVLEISSWLTVTWVLYRVILLAVILWLR
jgi:hypothetical protein